jgi:hypothetical protein
LSAKFRKCFTLQHKTEQNIWFITIDSAFEGMNRDICELLVSSKIKKAKKIEKTDGT